MIKLNIKLLIVLFFLFLSACGQNSAPAESFGIVSLSPSITRQIVDLDAEDLLVGVTSYHPPLSREVPSIGTLVLPNIEKILLLQPAIVLFSQEDSLTQRLDPLKTSGLALHGFGKNIGFEAICANYIELGRLIGKEKEAKVKAAAYRKELAAAKRMSGEIRVLMLVSWEPLITASDNTFIGQIICDAGGKNIFSIAPSSYPIIAPEAVVLRNPDVVIIMSGHGNDGGFNANFDSFKIRAIQNGNVFAIDPEHIAYFTPKDYIAAVNEIAAMLLKASASKSQGY